MSSSLTAEPVERKKLELGTALKFALRKQFGEPVNIKMNDASFMFLKGLIAGASDSELIKDAQNLAQYITKHGEVIIREEY